MAVSFCALTSAAKGRPMERSKVTMRPVSHVGGEDLDGLEFSIKLDVRHSPSMSK